MKSQSREISLCFRVDLKILTETSWWHCCRGASQISERWDNFKHKSCGFETSRDFTMRRLIRVQSDIETGSKPCHGGPWTVNASRGFRSCFIHERGLGVSGLSDRKYGYQLFNVTMRHHKLYENSNVLVFVQYINSLLWTYLIQWWCRPWKNICIISLEKMLNWFFFKKDSSSSQPISACGGARFEPFRKHVVYITFLIVLNLAETLRDPNKGVYWVVMNLMNYFLILAVLSSYFLGSYPM